MSERPLSKSRFLSGLQCPKLLWTLCNAGDLVPAADPATQALFDQGHEIGKLAQTLYPGGVEIPWDKGMAGAIRATAALLAQRQPVFEASFRAGGVCVRADILDPVPGGAWDLVEVKSSTSVKDVHIPDLAVQRHCCEKSGLRIRRCALLHVNSGYVRQGAVDARRLFAAEDVTDRVAEAAAAIEKQIAEMEVIVAGHACPDVGIGPHCDIPYACPLKGSCWRDALAPPDNIFTLNRLRSDRLWKLYAEGVRRISDLPAPSWMSGRQRIQAEAERTGRIHVDRDAVAAFLGTLKWPLHFLDFETFATAIPLVEGVRPYQQVPFQYSLHVAAGPGKEAVRFAWLWDGKGDPQRLMLETLVADMSPEGSVVAYNAAFERRVLREAARALPEHAAWVSRLESRVADLLEPFASFSVYHPDQHGSASLKAVLPALTGKGYEGMAISDGSQASAEFLRVTFGAASEEERSAVRDRLGEYCGLDTCAMLDIVEELNHFAQGQYGHPA